MSSTAAPPKPYFSFHFFGKRLHADRSCPDFPHAAQKKSSKSEDFEDFLMVFSTDLIQQYLSSPVLRPQNFSHFFRRLLTAICQPHFYDGI